MRLSYNLDMQKRRRNFGRRDNSWESDSRHYNSLVGEDGHFFHQEVILPGLLRGMELEEGMKVLDLGCGQGVLARALPKGVKYWGVDASRSLVEYAKSGDKNPEHVFEYGDAQRVRLKEKDFDWVAVVLALQNMEEPKNVFETVAWHLKDGGRFVVVMNHPSFRIPRQSGWGEGENKLQHRWVNRYMSPLKVPITMHPGQQRSAVTWSYHFPLSYYSQAIKDAGMVIEEIDEWNSTKQSQGKAAKMENRARSEFPLFMVVWGRKN